MRLVATMVVSTGSLTPTRLPAVTAVRDSRPSIGALMRVNSRFRRAASSAASPARTPPAALSAWARRSSASWREMAFSGSSFSARSSWTRASAAWLRAAARLASRRRTSAANGRGSMVNSRAPRRTAWPSRKCTRSSVPATRARTSTCSTAAKRALKSSNSSTWRRTAGATSTCGGAAAPGGTADWAPRSQPEDSSAEGSSAKGSQRSRQQKCRRNRMLFEKAGRIVERWSWRTGASSGQARAD